MRVGGALVYLTSHEAHFRGGASPYPPYRIIADTKRDGEDALRAMSDAFDAHGVRLNVVSADILPDSYTGRLLEMKDPGLLARRAGITGPLPTTPDVADEVIRCCLERRASGSTTYVWEPGPHYRSAAPAEPRTEPPATIGGDSDQRI